MAKHRGCEDALCGVGNSEYYLGLRDGLVAHAIGEQWNADGTADQTKPEYVNSSSSKRLGMVTAARVK